MSNFWDFSVWGGLSLVAVLMFGLFLANYLKKTVKFLRDSLIPTSVLGGIILLLISSIYEWITGNLLFNTDFFGGNGMAALEVITYHALALGFIATAFKGGRAKHTKKRNMEIFNTGVTTVSTYLLQGVLGLGITLIVARIVTGFFPAAGVILPFGYGQGTGQALNYGSIYESDYGFVGGRSFGLTIAALGFLSASIGGVIHMNIMKRRGKIVVSSETADDMRQDEIQKKGEIPMNGTMDKMTVQIGLVVITYMIAYLLMYALSLALLDMRATIYGFNFLIGVLMSALMKVILSALTKKNVIKHQYVNTFLMTRIGNFFFDIMVIAGIAAIRLDVLKNYWLVILILGVVGALSTYYYNYYVAKKLFSDYTQEQFLGMYGMLTGTASTGIILLREIDPKLITPASDNLVYQNFPAIVFGFPLMLLATLAPKQPELTLLILAIFFAVMNVILFRARIFKKRSK